MDKLPLFFMKPGQCNTIYIMSKCIWLLRIPSVFFDLFKTACLPTEYWISPCKLVSKAGMSKSRQVIVSAKDRNTSTVNWFCVYICTFFSPVMVSPVQTWQDKVGHRLQWFITPLNKALRIKVGRVLKNSGNSLFNGHWNFFIWTKGSWDKWV